MNKVLFTLLLLFLGQYSLAQDYFTINDKPYRIDTLIYKHQVGPGTEYVYIDLPDFPLKIHVLEVKLNNPHVKLETCLGGDSAVATERPTQMAIRKSTPGHDVFAATNGDFYFFTDPVEIGIPRSGQFIKNECVTNPVGRAAFVLDKNNRPYIDRIDFSGTVKSNDKTVRLHTVNMQRLEWEPQIADLLTLYTNAYGTYTSGIKEGTKVVLTPKRDETFFFSANKDITCVVEEITENHGFSPIPEGKAVLHGRGTSSDFLKALKAGDELVINLKTDLRNNPGMLDDFKELMGGSDHILLKDGQRYEGDESANPRTGIGFSKDSTTVYLVEVDGRQTSSRGVTLFEFGDIFKSMGVWNAVNLDGGGSSVMYVNGEVKNSPSDGAVRPVGNGMLVVSVAPEDKEVASISFAPVSYTLPACGYLKLAVYAYNKYGDLLSKDLQGVSFSCNPEIGYITTDGNFVGSEKTGTGVLIAEYNGVKTSRSVSLVESSFKLRLDSVLLNNISPYHIELLAEVENKTMFVAPELLQWEVDDPAICSVTDGVLTGLSDGLTYIRGSLGDFTCKQKVKVEIPSEKTIAMPVLTTPSWSIKSTSNIKNIKLEPDGIAYEYSSGRSPFIELTHDFCLYSLPTSMRMTLNPEKAGLSKITISMRANDKSAYTPFEFTDISKNEIKEIVIPTSDILADVNNRGGYPIHFHSMRFAFTSDNPVGANKIQIKEMCMEYDYITVGFSEMKSLSRLFIYPNPAKKEACLNVSLDEKSDINLMIYTNTGTMIACEDYKMSDGKNLILPISNLLNGTYLVKVSAGGKTDTVKLIIHN